MGEKFHCGQCGYQEAASKESSESSLVCPQCGAARPLEQTSNRPSLSLSKDRSMNENLKSCPACDGVVPMDHRICLQCGYDWKTHKSRKTVFQKKTDRKQRLPLVILAFILLGVGVWLFMHIRNPIDTRSLSLDIPYSIEELKQMDYEKWLTVLEQHYPLLHENDHAVLELLTGQVLRGEILSIDVDAFVIDAEIGRKEFKFADLRPKSRILLDPTYRENNAEKARVDIFGS